MPVTIGHGEKNDHITRGSGYTQVFISPNRLFTLSFSKTANYNQNTGNPFSSVDDYVGMPYKVKTVVVDGREGRQPLPRAGSENVSSASFFSKDSRSIYTLELQTGESSLTVSGDDIKDGQETFNQTLFTLRFTD